MARRNLKYRGSNQAFDYLKDSTCRQLASIPNQDQIHEGDDFGNIIKLLKSYLDNAVSSRPAIQSSITLGEFIIEHEKLMQKQISHSYLKDQIRVLRYFEIYIGSSVLLSKINSRQAEAFISMRYSSGVSISTVNKDIRTLKRIFNLAIDPRGYIPENQNPFLKIKQRKKASKKLRYVSVEEYKRLIEFSKRLWWKALIAIAYGSGLRRAEILNLTWSDIDFDNKQLKVTPKQQTETTIEWEPKDHEARVIPMTDQASHFLKKLRISCPQWHSYLFISVKRLKIIRKKIELGLWYSSQSTHNNLIRDFYSIQESAGVMKCTLHDLRRSAITNWGNILPIQVVQQFAGHSDIHTTRKYYLVVRDEDMKKASNVINKILDEGEND